MMKRSIDWHEECLQNQRDHLKREREKLDRQIATVDRLVRDLDVYVRQVKRAKRLDKDGFDRDKFKAEDVE